VSVKHHVLVLVAVMALQAGAPLRQADSMTGLIVGQVVDADSGRPVNGAIIVMLGPPGPNGVPLPRVLTGSDGRFVFRGLRGGNYNITAIKAGYVNGAYGRTRPAGPSVSLPLGDGERTGDAVVRVWKQAAISGAVVDESGERLIGVRVQAYRRTVIAGRQRYVSSGSALTDDRGIYRVSGLVPGDYIVGAIARQTIVPLSMGDSYIRADAIGIGLPMRPVGGPVLPVRDAGIVLGAGAPTPPPAENGRLAMYPPTFHPNAPTGDSATVIPLRAGAEYLSADLQLKPVPTASISGHVVGPEGAVTMTPLRLVAANTIDISLENDSTTTMTDRAGRFTFPAVPAGHYSLRLRRGAMTPGDETQPNALIWTDLAVSVGGEDIDELVVEAYPGVRVGGRIEFEGSSRGAPPFTSVSVTVEPADPSSSNTGGALATRGNTAGEFQSRPLPGGRYYVRVQNSPSGWMFKSATAEGRDVTDIPMNLVADAHNVVVTFTDRWSGLRGFVQNRQGPDAAAAVLVFPTDTETWASSGISPRRVRLLRPGKTGEYSLNLPAGEYYVIAVPDAQTADWQDAAFLDAASRAAIRVSIVEGERKTQDLRTREMR
jgi:hypothetical protein